MTDSNQSGLSDNFLGAIAYFTLVPALFFLAIAPYNKKLYVRFHAWQSLILNIFVLFISWVLNSFAVLVATHGITALMVLGWTWIAFLVVAALLFIWCIVSALNGKLFKVPCIGAWCEKQANR
jgi:uncharacterized membrane protein